MKRSENAISIYQELYFNPNETEVEQVHNRVANCIGNSKKQINKFEQILNDNIFRPNSPCMINARLKEEAEKLEDHDNNLVACFVIKLEDNMSSIMNMWSTCAKVYAGGGGTGFPITNLREKNSPIAAGGVASGPIEYMKVVQRISDTVKSGGKSRRAANLGCGRYNHPDIIEFINCKNNYDFSAINISVSVDDWFMNQVELENWEQKIELISPNHKKVVGELTVKEIWDEIINNAWSTGDPGLFFIDIINKNNPLPSLGKIESANPCGEVPLQGDSSCDLGSINLTKFIEESEFKFERFKEVIKTCVEFLDQIIDITSFPNKNIEQMMKKTRPIGLGIMGLADLFYKLEMTYGSKESITLFEEICKNLTITAFEKSIDLAEEKGSIDLGQDKDHFYNLLLGYGLSKEYLDKFKKVGIRNSNVTCIAPTGSISITAECSYAFEPQMALIWEKPLSDRNKTLKFINKDFLDACFKLNIIIDDEKINEIINNKGSIQSLDYPEEVKNIFITAHDLGWKKKLEMQGVAQKYISLAISSTCNMPNSATKKDVEEAYKLAYKLNLKGITIYRDGCKNCQPVNFGQIKDKDSTVIEPIKLPSKRIGETIKLESPNGTIYITGNKVNGKLIEIFLAMGQIGQLENLLINSYSKQISKSLQYHMPINIILDQMEGQGGLKFWFKLDEEKDITVSAESLLDAISKIIRYHFIEEEVDGYSIKDKSKSSPDESYNICPACGKRTLTFASGCRSGMCMNPKCTHGFSCG